MKIYFQYENHISLYHHFPPPRPLPAVCHFCAPARPLANSTSSHICVCVFFARILFGSGVYLSSMHAYGIWALAYVDVCLQ